MKYRHVFWAFILIAIGVLFLLNNFRVITFGFSALVTLWPLILVLWGISILPIRDLFKIIALVAVLALTVIFYNPIQTRSSWMPHHFRFNQHDWNDNNDEEETYNYQPQNLSVPFDSLTKKGILKLDAAAGKFTIQGTTSDFLSFSKTGDIGNYSLSTSDSSGRKKISLSLEKATVRHSVSDNKVDVRLNDKPAWNIDLNIGASDFTMDLRDYKIDTAAVHAGACSLHIKLGEKSPITKMTFETGMATIKIVIPKGSGCQVKSESFLVSKDFDGFSKKGDGIYETENFRTAGNKIYITMKSAFAKFEITRE